MARLTRAAFVALAGAAVLAATAPAVADEPMAIVTAEVAAEAFLATCGRLGDDPAVQSGIEGSPFAFRRIEETGSLAGYQSAQAVIDYRPGDFCSLGVIVATAEDRDEVVRRLSERMNLGPARGAPLHNPAYVRFSWQLPPVEGRDRYLDIESYEPERSPHRPVSVTFGTWLRRAD